MLNTAPGEARSGNTGCHGGPVAAPAGTRVLWLSKALALMMLFLFVTDLVGLLRTPQARDFISFWSAARVALDGHSVHAYQYEILQGVQNQVAAVGGELPFPYPPLFLAVLIPFALLPYPVALGAWAVSTFLLYRDALHRLIPNLGWLAAAYPPILATALVGQNGFVTAAILIWGMALLPTRPFCAGLVFGCLILKPQLGFLLPVALIAAAQWRALAGAAVASAGALLLGVLLFGISTSVAWVEQMPYFMEIARSGGVGWHKLTSVNAALRHLGLAANIASFIHAAVAIAAAAAVWQVWRSSASWGAKFAILASGTMLVSPYIYVYDCVLLIVALAWFGRVYGYGWQFWLLWLLPAVTIAQITLWPSSIPVSPLAPILLTFLVWLNACVGKDDPVAKVLAHT